MDRLDPKVEADLDRLMRTFVVGQRVRASLGIFYALTGLCIGENEQGTVAHVPLPGLVAVRWDRIPTIAPDTSAYSLDPVDSLRFVIETLVQREDAIGGIWVPSHLAPACGFFTRAAAEELRKEIVALGFDGKKLRVRETEEKRGQS